VSEPAPTPAPKPVPGGLAWPVIGLAALADQISKFLVVQQLAAYPDPRGYQLFPGMLHFLYKRNTGVAFSMFERHPEILAYLTTAAIIAIGWWAWQTPREEWLVRLSFGLVLGGAVGNLIDRWMRGYVVDFVDFIFPGPLGRWHDHFFGSRHFATFNLADTWITIGMVLLIAAMLFAKPAPPPAEGKMETPTDSSASAD
jgi:signal peptidase II